jgi:manganese transport protein
LPEPVVEPAEGPAPATADAPGDSPALATPHERSPLEQVFARGRVRAIATMLGPAFVAAVAYIDPGNFATNIQGGAKYGDELLWVVLAANLIAMLVQYLSAKLGIATGRSLPEACRLALPRWGSIGLWGQAELIAMSTDVAEFLGAAIGLNLLFGAPPIVAGIITGLVAFAILGLQQRGFRAFELAIIALLGIVLLGFLYETVHVGPSAHLALDGLVPHLGGSESAYLAVGIVGATVMPHVIYLHSALTKDRITARDGAERRRLLRYQRLDVFLALSIAGLINMAMLVVAATLLHVPGLAGTATIEAAHSEFGRVAGGGAALAFAIALLASGLSSSSVGTYAGQVVMTGFTGWRIPVLLRRGLTMIPALVILAVGVNPTSALVLSQVVLSFGIPFAVIPLVILTSRRDVMGVHVNRLATTVLAWACAVLISGLNVFLIVEQLVR